jgi:DNA-binding NtrC family response regulator
MSRGKVLIVEDQLLIANDMKMQLTQLGYDIVGICMRGNIAIEFLEKERENPELFPDVVLTDISLAGKMNGIEMGKVVHEKFDMAVVYISGLGDLNLIEEILKAKPEMFLIKPFDVYFAHIHLQMAISLLRLEKNYKRLRDGMTRLLEGSMEL